MRLTKRGCALLLSLLLCLGALTAEASVYAGLLMRLSTRTGPGTQYEEVGTYFQNDWKTANLEIISAAYDDYNEIWWVQVDFSVRGTNYRAYTGLKRVDVDVNTLYHEAPLGTARMTSAGKAYWGPGRDYKESKYNVPNHTNVTVYNAENGFVQVEFFDARTAKSARGLRRAWVTERAVSGVWSSPIDASSSLDHEHQSEPFSFCPQCGKELPQDGNFAFCPYCGAALSASESPSATGLETPWNGPGVPISLKSVSGDRLRPQCGPGYGYKQFRSVANNGDLLYLRAGMFDIRALYTMNDWVYVSFMYSDGQPRMGYFENSLFNLGTGIPEAAFTTGKTGVALSSITPYNGPGTQYGDYPSCRLKAGDSVSVYFEQDGWVFGEFYTKGNDYGYVQLWMPASQLNLF